MKITVEVKKMENRKIMGKMSKIKSWFFEKNKRVGKTLARLSKQTRKTQITKIKNEKETF
jgi:hypothetical protein